MKLRGHFARLGFLLAIGGASLSAVPAARADQAAEEAAKAFEQGRKLWDAKDPAAALPYFQKAAERSNSPNARLYVARCLRETGKLPQAYDEMERTLRDARDLAEKDQRYAQTRDTAAAELALLEPRIGKLVIALGSSLAGAQVTIEGALVEPARLGKPVAVTPGNLRIVARSADASTTERSVAVAAGSTVTVTLERALPGSEPPPGAPPAEPRERAEEQGGGFGVVRGLGIGVAAIGVGGFVMFAIGTVQADDKLATLEEACGGGPCTDPKYEDVIESGKTSEIVAYAGLGIGVAGVVAGTLMMIFGGPTEPDAKAAAWEPTPNGVRFRF